VREMLSDDELQEYARWAASYSGMGPAQMVRNLLADRADLQQQLAEARAEIEVLRTSDEAAGALLQEIHREMDEAGVPEAKRGDLGIVGLSDRVSGCLREWTVDRSAREKAEVDVQSWKRQAEQQHVADLRTMVQMECERDSARSAREKTEATYAALRSVLAEIPLTTFQAHRACAVTTVNGRKISEALASPDPGAELLEVGRQVYAVLASREPYPTHGVWVCVWCGQTGPTASEVKHAPSCAWWNALARGKRWFGKGEQP
jgi:hypothetical protein